MNETQTENSTKLHQQNSDENPKIDNINASKISSVEGKVTNEGINETNVICEQKYRLVSEDCVKVASEINNAAGTSTSWDTAFGEINQTSCVQKDRLPNEDCVKVSNETNNEAGTSTGCGIDFVSSGITDSATKTIEKTEESSTNLSENVDSYQILKVNITAGSDKVTSLKTYESSVDSVETITNKNFELKETISNKNIESSTDGTDWKSNNTKELKLTVDSNITQTINEPDLPNSLENVGKKDEITNKSIKKKPLSAREILKKSIEIRGRRLERIAVSQSLEKVELKNDPESNNVEEGKVVDDKVSITNSGFEGDSCKAETFVKNVTKSIDKVANRVCFLEDEKGKKEKFNGDRGIKNSESLSESVVEVNGTVDETGVDLVEKTSNKNNDENCGECELLANLSIINSDEIVVEQNFNKKIEENVGEKCLGATLQARNFKETTDDNVEKATDENIEKSTDENVEKPLEENIEKQVSLRRGRRRKLIISQNLRDNVNSSIVNNIEVDGKCIEEYSTLPKTRKLRKRTAPCQDIAGKSDENIEVQEENSSGRNSLNNSLEDRRKIHREVNSSQNVDSNELQSLEEPGIGREVNSFRPFDPNEYENLEKSSINLKLEGTVEEPLTTVVAQRKLLKTGMRKLKNKNDCQIIENVGKSVDKVYKTCENVGDLLKKFDKNSEKVSKGSTKVKDNRGRPKKSAKSIIGNDQNTFCEIGGATNGSNGNKLTNIDDLLRDVLRNLTKSCGEKVITLPNNSAQNGDNFSKIAAENVNNLSESVNSLSNCETNTNTVVAIKKKVGRPKKVRKTLKARKLLESTSSNSKTSDVCEESNNSCDSNGNKKVCRPKKARKGRSEVEKLLESASNFTSNISEACEESTSSAVADVNQLLDNCNVAAVNRLELVSKKLRKGCRTNNSSKYMECDGKDPLENIVVMMEDGPKTTLDPEVQLLNEMNKSKSVEENPDPEPPSCPRYSTNNLTEDGLRMIIKKEINNSAEKHTSSPEIYEESSFEYGNVAHKVRYIIRKEKAKLVETTVGNTNDTYNEENIGSNLTEEIMNLALTQAIKAEPIDNPENLLLETENNETREYTMNSTEQKDTFDEKPFANQPQTVKFRTKNRGRGRNSFLIPKTVDINGYVNRCKQTTVDTVDDKKYNKKQCGNYTMEIKTEIAENNSFIDENSDSLGIKTGLNQIRRRRRVSKRGRGRLRASDRVVNGYKLCENLVKNVENESGSVENCRNLRSTSRLFENCGISDLKNDVINSTMDVRSIRNSMEDVESVRNSTEDVESVRNSTEDVENSTNHTKSGENRTDDDNEIVRNCTIDIRSVRNSTEDIESLSDEENVKNSTIDIRSVRNSTEDNDNVEISAKNSKEVAGNVKNSTVTSSNRILVKSLASLMGNSGSNQGTNLLNSPCTSKSSSNKSLVKNLANIVSKLDSIAKNNLNNDEESASKIVSNDDSIAENNLKNCEESVREAVLNNDEVMVENRIDSNDEVIVNLNTLDLDSNMDDSEVTVSKISDSNSNNNVSAKLDCNSGEIFNENGTISTSDGKVLSSSSTSCENSTKSIPNDKLDKFNIDENVGRSLRKRKKIVNYDDNFVKIVDNYSGVGQNLDGFGEKNENLTSFIDNSPPSKHVILKSPAKIFSRKIKLSSKTNYTGRLKVFCDKSNDNVKFTSPVKVEANTVPLDFSCVSNSADTVSNNAHDVSNGSNLIGSVSNSNRLLGSAVSNGNSLLNTGSNTDVSNSDRLLNIVSNGDYLLDTVSNGDDRLLDTVSNRDESDYEEKYGDVLEAERLKDNEEEFLKTIESFLEEEIEKHAEENGKKARKKRRRQCELPPLPDMLKCATCGKVLKNRQSYEYHVTTHTDPRKQLMKCNCCSKVLVGEKRFKSHMYKFHTLVKTYSCDRCKKIFHTRHNLYKHMVNVHLKLKTYTCDICKKSFKRKSYLTLHINMHMGIRPHECNLCGKNFLSKSDLQNHLDAHVGFDRYVCGVCGKRASNMHSLQVHMKSIHTRENLFKCRRCGKEYGTRSCLREHMNLHTGKTYECEKCGEKFPYRNSLKRHLKTHEGKKQKCEICHKVFQRKCYLKKHMTIHSGTEKFMCVYCGKKFIEKSDFNQHVNRHTHAEKFPCEFCGKVFHSKGYLVNHRKMHTGDTKHVCKYCGKKFMKKGLLERHESIHEGTNFVQCDLCGAVLSSVNSCRRHVRNVHGVVL